MPDFSHERRLGGVVAGVDEVGRGPLAGPVMAAAAILPLDMDEQTLTLIDDSKRLSARRRAIALSTLLSQGAVFGLGAASVREIEDLNILRASHLAMRRAVRRLPCRPNQLLIDGPNMPDIDVPGEAVIGGDRVSLSIAAASIFAKQYRDKVMVLLAAKYPGYSWADNVGYGTAAHRSAIILLGPTPHHRVGFGPLLRGGDHN